MSILKSIELNRIQTINFNQKNHISSGKIVGIHCHHAVHRSRISGQDALFA